jgi:plastocyanin
MTQRLPTITIVALLAVLFCPAGAWGKEHRVEIDGLKYKPAKITVKKGDTVVWVNSDDRDHTVVSKDKGKTFDSGKIAAGEKFTYKFGDAGKFEYGCEYHPRMKGTVEVTD